MPHRIYIYGSSSGRLARVAESVILVAEPRGEKPEYGSGLHRQLCSLNFSLKFRQRTSLVHGNVISFVAPDLILRITFSSVMHVTLVLHVLRVFPDDNSFNVSGFGVPSDMVSNSELLHYSRSFQDTRRPGAAWQAALG